MFGLEGMSLTTNCTVNNARIYSVSVSIAVAVAIASSCSSCFFAFAVAFCPCRLPYAFLPGVCCCAWLDLSCLDMNDRDGGSAEMGWDGMGWRHFLCIALYRIA